MVMGRVRATSYVRRTLSQPIHKPRVSSVILRQPPQPAAGSGPGAAGGRDISAQLEDGVCHLTTGAGAPSRQLHLGLLSEGWSSLGGAGEGAFMGPSSDSRVIDEEVEDLNDYYRFTLKEDMQRVWHMLSGRLNLFLVFVPLSFWSVLVSGSPLFVFVCNFLALIPLASLLGNATEELALHTGEIIGGLLNATFGNAVEMIMSVQALRVGLLSVVQGTMLGSILSNLLLVLGMSFFAGGIRYHVQKFNEKGATCSVTLLLLSCMSIVIPTVAASGNDHASPTYDIIKISRTIAVLIGLTYCLFLFFQLYTHLNLFRDDEDGEEEWPSMSWEAATVILFIVTLLIAVHSEYLVGSIHAVVTNYGLPESFIGVILLPIVGNAAEHLTAVTVAMKNKVDLAMGVAVGSSAQIALFVFPFTVCAGWALDQPLTLAVQPMSALVLLMAVLVAMAIVQDGESNWLEGVMLMAAYLMIAIVFWYNDPNSSAHAATSVGGKGAPASLP
ncbi:calcium/proton antiporter, related [Neospora caninum Liverpool]|uniref:Calcium/proton antiporter, related n=1 Tax=Neospora caninum (strain Liverpool) TaxID=572307 RepID=F0V7V4_NEOCL|nr:calcium/proton antiporter, related [Neospora caninum Liverpool]CBZ49795.1 calcium/proton antiporter, related [Neospora caninum Liverpool]CEL64382.1 TPA: Calcium/proton antiporter, related [Neospora caninum Liverpool]|eukprot:XP_003879830.1 calcium/proton antiporter, related [Neospora caninum Liverpool]